VADPANSFLTRENRLRPPLDRLGSARTEARDEDAMMSTSHRKRVRSYNIPGHAHELTFSCFQRLPLLSKDRTCRWFVDAMESARRELSLSLWAYVIMPEHAHVLLCPRPAAYEVRLIRTALKVPVQRKALQYLRQHTLSFLERLGDGQPNGKVSYRFWQRGGGYDRNVIEPATVLQMIAYLHNNPVRRGLVPSPTDWVWSSARFYAGYANVPIRMDRLPCLDG
jgi:putative transposase